MQEEVLENEMIIIECDLNGNIVLGKSTMKQIFCMEKLIDKYKEKRRNLTMIFVDLEKAYDREII